MKGIWRIGTKVMGFMRELLFAQTSRVGPGTSVAFVLLMGALLSVMSFALMRQAEQETLATEFEGSFERSVWLLNNYYTEWIDGSNLGILETVRGAFAQDPRVDEERIRRWGEGLLWGEDLYRSYLLFVPRLAGSQLDSRGRPVLPWQGSSFVLREEKQPPHQDRLRAVRRRDTGHYPIELVAPLQSGSRLLGFDLASDPVLRAVMEWCRDTARSAQVRRFPVESASDEYTEWFYFLPLYADGTAPTEVVERRQALLGFAVTLFVSPMTSQGLAGVESVALEESAHSALRNRDRHTTLNLGPDDVVGDIAHRRSVVEQALASTQRPIRVASIEQAGRRWAVLSYPSLRRVRSHRSKSPWVALVSGLFITLLLSGFVGRSVRRYLQVKALAARRTKDLQESEERYALAGRGATDGLWDWDLKRQKIYYSPRWREALGFDESEIGNSYDEWFSRVHPEDLDKLQEALDSHLENQRAFFETEYRIQDKHGVYRWMLSRGVAVRNENGVPYRLVGSQTEVTKRKLAEEQLHHDALHDALTGLPNRAMFMDQLQQALEKSQNDEDSAYAVLFLDIDRFKVINDSLGHVSGDALLVSVAQRIRQCLRPTDLVARLGGDEFTVLITQLTNLNQARALAIRIQQSLCEPLALDGREIVVTASIGITLSSNGYQAAAHVLRDADIAMYRAKAQGTARYEIFTLNMRHEAAATMELETDLRYALERDQLRVLYQPIVDLRSQRIHGFEALLRWERPDNGVVQPEDFIKIAEETDLIVPFGLWVLREACVQMKDWLERLDPAQSGDLAISVNVSPLQLRRPNFYRHVARVLEETSLPARHLMFEITESTIIDDAESQLDMIHEVQKMGARILIDDFGTGYSSLHYLDRFKVDALKIDRTFINTEIVGAIVRFAHNLGIEVIAEGVETDKQVAGLQDHDCDYVQGYYYSAPVDVGGAEEQLLSHGHVFLLPEARTAGRVLRSQRFERKHSGKAGNGHRSAG